MLSAVWILTKSRKTAAPARCSAKPRSSCGGSAKPRSTLKPLDRTRPMSGLCWRKPAGNSFPRRQRAKRDRPQRQMEECVDFKGKVALITGAGNGIGRASAIGFASPGAKVVVVDRDKDAGEATAGILRQQGGDALFVAADVTRSAEVQNYVKAALDAYGSIDCFHNNAGIEGSVAPTAEYEEEMFDRVMAVNVKGV